MIYTFYWDIYREAIMFYAHEVRVGVATRTCKRDDLYPFFQTANLLALKVYNFVYNTVIFKQLFRVWLIWNYTLSRKKYKNNSWGIVSTWGQFLYRHAEWIKTRHLTEQIFDWRLRLGNIDENVLLWWPLTIYIMVQF